MPGARWVMYPFLSGKLKGLRDPEGRHLGCLGQRGLCNASLPQARSVHPEDNSAPMWIVEKEEHWCLPSIQGSDNSLSHPKGLSIPNLLLLWGPR